MGPARQPGPAGDECRQQPAAPHGWPLCPGTEASDEARVQGLPPRLQPGGWTFYPGVLLFIAPLRKASIPRAAWLNAWVPRHDAGQEAEATGAKVAPVVRGLCAAHRHAMGEGTGRKTRPRVVPARHRVCA